MKSKRKPFGFGTATYFAIISTDDGTFATVPFTVPSGPQSKDRAEATCILMMSALQEPYSAICWDRLSNAIGTTSDDLYPLTMELGEDFIITLRDDHGHHIQGWESQARVMRLTEGNVVGLRAIGVDEIEDILEVVK